MRLIQKRDALQQEIDQAVQALDDLLAQRPNLVHNARDKDSADWIDAEEQLEALDARILELNAQIKELQSALADVEAKVAFYNRLSAGSADGGLTADNQSS